MSTKTKTPSTKTATNKGKVKKPASTKLKFPFPKPRKPSQLDRIEAALTGLVQTQEEQAEYIVGLSRDLSLIRSGMDFQKELDRVAPEAPKPASLQPGDYCQSDEHHDLKEVAERLTAMGHNVYSARSVTYPALMWTGTMLQGDNGKGADKAKLPIPEFLSRAEVTAKELGLTPVVPEPWRPKVNGLAKYDGLVGKVTDHSTSVGEWWFIDGRWVPTHKISEPSPAEVAAHQAEIAAKEEAARTPKFGDRVEYQDAEWKIASDSTDCLDRWLVTRRSCGDILTNLAKRHEFKILP